MNMGYPNMTIGKKPKTDHRVAFPKAQSTLTSNLDFFNINFTQSAALNEKKEAK